MYRVYSNGDTVYATIEGKLHVGKIVGRIFPSCWFILLDSEYSLSYPYRCVLVTAENVNGSPPEEKQVKKRKYPFVVRTKLEVRPQKSFIEKYGHFRAEPSRGCRTWSFEDEAGSILFAENFKQYVLD